MKRLRLYFAGFFLLLSITLGFLLRHTYRQIGLEERELWREQAEKIYNQMQASVSEFLTAEDRRSLNEYRFSTPLSPIAYIPSGDPRGLVGYFQIDPDGTFSTPYLPKNLPPGNLSKGADGTAPDGEPRRKLENELEEIASSLKPSESPASTPKAPTSPSPKRGRRFVEPRLPNETLNLAIDITGTSSFDPFQARLVNERTLLFYRKVWKDKAVTIQGFAVDLRRFYDWLMEQTFANSEFPDFALTRLEVTDTPIAQYGLDELDLSNKPPFFVRALGAPLNRFEWKIYVDRLPRAATRLFLNILSGVLFVLLTVGLYLIYRASASQVTFSQKRQDFVTAVTREIKTSLAESGHLSRLIDNVLQLDRLEKKACKLNLKKEHPSADFKEMAEELKKMAERQGFSLTVEVGPNVPPIICDPEAVKQILLTFLDNSMKFVSETYDQSLEISLVKEKGEVIFGFRDRGPGIAPGDLKKVFQTFYRGENEMTRKTKGMGIGLAMTRMLAQAMGAHVEARNRDKGGLEVRLVFKVFR